MADKDPFTGPDGRLHRPQRLLETERHDAAFAACSGLASEGRRLGGLAGLEPATSWVR